MDNSSFKIDRAFDDLALMLKEPPREVDTKVIVEAATEYASHNAVSTPPRVFSAKKYWWNVVWIVPVFALVSTKLINVNAPQPAPQQRTYSTANAQRANVTLPGGTQVYLAPASSLKLSGATVTLTGHAIFTVKHKTNSPFTVVANGVTTRVLGTTFSVRAYPGEGRTRVAVKEGRVSVQPATVTSRSVVILNVNEGVFVENDGRAQVINNVVIDDFAAMSGKLVLREAPLGEALLELKRWYGLDFRAADSSLLARQITTTLPEHLSADVLQEMAAALGARVQQRGNTVTFESK